MAVLLICFLICQPYILAFQDCHIKVQKSEAQAVPAAIPAAYAFIEAAAAAAGVSVPDFLVTVAIGTSAISGANIVSTNAKYGADDTSTMLSKIISTAEWPRYDDLSDDQKQEYGSANNYYSQQWNNYLGCVGLGDVRDQYYGSGGGTFDEGATSKLERIGEIATRWKDGEMVPVSQLVGLEPVAYDYVNPSTGKKLYKDYGAGPITYTFISASSSNGYEVVGDEWYAGTVNGAGYTGNLGDAQWRVSTSQDNSLPVIKLEIGSTGYKFSPSTSAYTYTWKDGRIIRSNAQSGVNASLGSLANGTGANFTAANGRTLNIAYPYYDYSALELVGETVDDLLPDGDFAPDEYPGDGVGSDNIGPETKWPSLFIDIPDTPEEPYQPTPNPYNPDNVTGTPEWQDGVNNDLNGLKQGVNLQMLFPFCLLFDVELLANKVLSTAGVAKSDAPSLSKGATLGIQSVDVSGGLPGKPDWVGSGTIISWDLTQFGFDTALTIDLWPLAVVIAYTRPGWQVALLVMLFTCTFRFWQGVITG